MLKVSGLPRKEHTSRMLEDAMEGRKKRKEEKNQFILDTVDAFVSANIPVLKLDNPLSKYVKGSGILPVSKVLREEYIPEVAKIHEDRIKEELKGKDIVIYSDETTDKGCRCVYNVFFQTLDPAPQQQLHLAASTVLDAANATNCANDVLDTLKRYEKNLEDVAAFNSDSARYMTKCFKTLKGLHEDLLLVQCWPHKLHHVGNTFQVSLPELNLTVKHVKKVFLNARKRKNNYLMFLQEKYPYSKPKEKRDVDSTWMRGSIVDVDESTKIQLVSRL
ncbi:CGG triplet repeat-binding protein 1 [Frankliniella fusca]|uniref:CGG triplet repeat-binding protein 1 n=1 Tax=Frankliniella fusca TaxID=407009 RepID=A0AAE1LFP2_9NEOP|nr:CGG triplet repeat-binding protein 1 [Frankliniella fusca]